MRHSGNEAFYCFHCIYYCLLTIRELLGFFIVYCSHPNSGYEMLADAPENMQPGMIVPINVPSNSCYCIDNGFNRP